MYKNFVKRMLDIIISLIALPFIAVVGVPIAALIKFEDNGTVFYISKRYGKNMNKFNMIKFRSMKMNAGDIRNEDGTTFNSENDERQTKIGRILRKTSLDELPQFINVIKGEMSIIGPRPSPMGNEATYSENTKKKFSVRPGITGYNQALLRNSASLEERYSNDVYYAENVGFFLDLRIFVMTIKSVFLRKNIYHS